MAYVVPHGRRIAVRVHALGKRFTTTIPLKPTQANLQAAQRAAKDAERRLKVGEDWASVKARLRGEEQPAPVQTLGFYAQHFLDHAEIADSTLDSYENIYHRYWSGFDQRSVGSLVRSELEAHINAFDVSRKTKKNAICVLRQILEIAVRDGVIASAPTDGWDVRSARVARSEPDPYSEAERDALLHELKTWPIAWRYFLTAFHTGMRTGELLGLEWHQLNQPHIVVSQSLVRRTLQPTTKTGRPRRVRAPQIVWDMLDVNPTKFRRSFVFLTPENRPFKDADWLMERWDRAHRSSNIRKRTGPYPWRHTYISLGLAHGATPIWMSSQTGHDMLTMSKHYARWIRGRDDADREELEKIYGGQEKVHTEVHTEHDRQEPGIS